MRPMGDWVSAGSPPTLHLAFLAFTVWSYSRLTCMSEMRPTVRACVEATANHAKEQASLENVIVLNGYHPLQTDFAFLQGWEMSTLFLRRPVARLWKYYTLHADLILDYLNRLQHNLSTAPAKNYFLAEGTLVRSKLEIPLKRRVQFEKRMA